MTPWIFATLLLFQTKVRYGPKADPTDFAVPVHVQASHLLYVSSSGSGAAALRLDVPIVGKKYDSERNFTTILLNPGDCKARLAKDKAKLAEELDREYDLLLSDGTVETFQVVGESE